MSISRILDVLLLKGVYVYLLFGHMLARNIRLPTKEDWSEMAKRNKHMPKGDLKKNKSCSIKFQYWHEPDGRIVRNHPKLTKIYGSE